MSYEHNSPWLLILPIISSTLIHEAINTIIRLPRLKNLSI